MYDPTIYKKIQLLGHVIDDIKELEANIEGTSDPALLMEYKQEMLLLADELLEVGNRIIHLIEVYMAGCVETKEPICLDFYRIYKELKKAAR